MMFSPLFSSRFLIFSILYNLSPLSNSRPSSWSQTKKTLN
ncbi:hypothetical protein HOLDEFILI_02553 [Holdemania filiformis DSM 12042]|uniref:Uncharacterized protein n=1 Tax=Holdemania filiformis DSM 12042 TaxID=545696 RepID=B9Y9P6_9FIRM|nr:hypothetical protein HOLDEFILI_02553 [Holdemania filiformis DSM 12042]